MNTICFWINNNKALNDKNPPNTKNILYYFVSHHIHHLLWNVNLHNIKHLEPNFAFNKNHPIQINVPQTYKRLNRRVIINGPAIIRLTIHNRHYIVQILEWLIIRTCIKLVINHEFRQLEWCWVWYITKN